MDDRNDTASLLHGYNFFIYQMVAKALALHVSYNKSYIYLMMTCVLGKHRNKNIKWGSNDMWHNVPHF